MNDTVSEDVTRLHHPKEADAGTLRHRAIRLMAMGGLGYEAHDFLEDVAEYLAATKPPLADVTDEDVKVRRRYYDTIETLIHLVTPTALRKEDVARFQELKEEHAWDGISCSCGGGWLYGHQSGCPEDQTASPPMPGRGEGFDADVMVAAEAMWRAETADMPAAHRARTAQAWTEQSASTLNKWLTLARAGLLAVRLAASRSKEDTHAK